MTLIGLTGYKQAGKDTIAGRLVNEYGFVRLAFADHLKSMALAIDPVTASFISSTIWSDPTVAVEHLSDIVSTDGWEVAKEEPTVREFLQRLGKEGVRDHISDTYWLDYVMDRVDDEFKDRDVVISDCRFANEGAAVRDRRGTIWQVDREGCEGGEHSSEQLPIAPDWVFTNNRTVDNLYFKVDKAMSTYYADRDA